MFIKRFSLFVFCTILKLSYARISVTRGCRDIPAKTHIDMEQYQGKWYTVEGFWWLTDTIMRCTNIQYKNFRQESGTFQAVTTLITKLTGKRFVAITNGTLNPERSGKYNGDTVMRLSPSHAVLKMKTTYSILDTDYQTYTIEWSCAPGGFPYDREGLWIMTRDRTYLPETRELVHQKLKGFGINSENLLQIDYTNCPA